MKVINHFLEQLLKLELGNHYEWLNCCSKIKKLLPLSEDTNTTPEGFLNPYETVIKLSEITRALPGRNKLLPLHRSEECSRSWISFQNQLFGQWDKLL